MSTKKLKKYTEITDRMLALYKAKNADYGDAFGKSYEDFGLITGVIRIGDKYNRLKTLVNREALVEESIEDTLLDLASYAIMTLIEKEIEHEIYENE